MESYGKTSAESAKSEVSQTFSSLTNTHNFDVLKRVFQGEEILISPLSSFFVMTMVYFGANGKTKQEMKEAFHITDEHEKRMLDEMNQMSKIIAMSNTEDVTSQIANAGFVDKRFHLHVDFVKMVQMFGKMDTMDYQLPEEARSHINGWVSANTNSMIPELLKSGMITTDTVLTLVNCLYFKANWEIKFREEATQKKMFRTMAKTEVEVDMMELRGKKFPYWEDDHVQFLEMPYKGNEYSMVVVLSKDHDGAKMKMHVNFDNLVSKLRKQKVNVKFPKFKQRCSQTLKDVFKDMGIRDLFDPVHANLSGLSPNGKDVYVSDVIQEVVVIVDETGTEAAAATAVMAMRKSLAVDMPEEFNADHTFQYYIRHVPTNTIMFYGVWDGKNSE